MKKTIISMLTLVLALTLCVGLFVGCNPTDGDNGPKLSTEVWEGDVIYVGNTAGTTGGLASIGGPFNLGIEAAFAAYNAAGGFNGKTVALKHYDDGGVATQAVTLMEKLVHEDEVFAIVGNFGSYAVDVNLETLKEEAVPMIYAAAGNNTLFNENATSDADRAIFPVQPLNQTEGRMLILRAFAPLTAGGLGATKVGVVSNSNEASASLLAGIKAEAANLPEAQRNNIVYQEVVTTDYSGAINALQAAGCDTVILTVIGADFTTALTTMANANYYCKALTSYNNASAAVFNVSYDLDGDGEVETTLMAEQYQPVFSKIALYAQAWIDITSATYIYSDPTSALFNTYVLANLTKKDADGNDFMAGFNEEYWVVANNIFNYALTADPANAFALSYDAYALAGYIAGDLFCKGLEVLEAQGKELTRANYVAAMESGVMDLALADTISFQNGMRAGVDAFALTSIFDMYNLDASLGGGVFHYANSATIHTLTSMQDYRDLLAA